MDLKEWTSGAGAPETKPWLTPVVFTLEAQDATVHGRITQENSRPTPYGLWASRSTRTLNNTTATYAMGSFTGISLIPATSLYPGHTTRVRVGGVFTVADAGGDTLTISIRNIADTYTYGSITLFTGGAVTAQAWSAEFELQVQATGAAGVGVHATSAISGRGETVVGVPGVFSTSNTSDATTFSTVGGVDYALYMSVGLATSTISKNVGVATVIF